MEVQSDTAVASAVGSVASASASTLVVDAGEHFGRSVAVDCVCVDVDVGVVEVLVCEVVGFVCIACGSCKFDVDLDGLSGRGRKS